MTGIWQPGGGSPRGRVPRGALRRGRARVHQVEMPLRMAARRAAPAVASVSRVASLALILALPFFAQVFHYLNELPPPYFLSKAWPILVFPLTLYGLIRMKLPGHNLFLLLLAYLLGFTPLVSIIQLGNGLFDALTTTVKAWPFTYYFGLSALLSLLALPAERVRAICLGYGAGTFALLVLIWIAAPASWYVTNPEDGKLLQYDVDRGYRVYLSMFFGMLFIFYLGRSFVIERKVWRLIAIPIAFLILMVIYKQRTAILMAMMVTGYGIVMALPRRMRQLAIGLGLLLAVPAVVVAAWVLLGGGLDNLQQSLGGSLSVRQNSAALASHYLGDHTLRWTFGVGATTRFGSVTLADIFGYDQFFIADLGWLGVVFEYGLIGALLIFAVHAWGFFITARLGAKRHDPFILALSDYLLYLLLTSAVYSLVFLPGEFGVALALAIYLGTRPSPGPPVANVPSGAARPQPE